MSKKDTTLYLRPGMAELLSKKDGMPAGAVGFGKVVSADSAKVTLAVDDATVKVAYDGAKPLPDVVIYFDANGKMLAMEAPPARTPAPARATTGAAEIKSTNTLY